MKLKLFILLFIATISFSAFSIDFTDSENMMVQDIFNFRLSLRSLPDTATCILEIHEYKDKHRETISSFSEEARLTCENMLATAEYNCEYEKDMHSPDMEKILRPQYDKITKYAQGKSAETLNPYFVLTSADITNSMMQFLPRSSSITLGLKEKKDYASVLEKNPGMSFALTLSGWWYYYAPAVGGGSSSKSFEFFKAAQENASSGYDKYYCNINLGQFYFEKKKTELCDKYMAEAERILPGTRYIAFLKKINSLGYSLFDYNMNSRREKIDRKTEI